MLAKNVQAFITILLAKVNVLMERTNKGKEAAHEQLEGQPPNYMVPLQQYRPNP